VPSLPRPKLRRLQRLNRHLLSSRSQKSLQLPSPPLRHSRSQKSLLLLSPLRRRNPSQKPLLLLGPPRRRSQNQKQPQPLLRRPRPVHSWLANLQPRPKRKLTARATRSYGQIPARRSTTTLQAADTATRRSAHTCARKKPQQPASGLPRGRGASKGFSALLLTA
jgi:hypothetical protein